MTLFTLLLVLAWERLFKLGEHWQLDHRLEVVFQRLHRVSLAQTLAMTAAWMVVVWGVLWLSHGLFFGVVTLLLCTLVGLFNALLIVVFRIPDMLATLASRGMGALSNAEGCWHLEQAVMRGAPWRLAMRV